MEWTIYGIYGTEKCVISEKLSIIFLEGYRNSSKQEHYCVNKIAFYFYLLNP